MRTKIFLIVLVLAFACTSTDNLAPKSSEEEFGTVAVQIIINGDSSTSPSTVRALIDGLIWNDLAPNRIYRARLSSGAHTISLLSLLEPNLPVTRYQHLEWCTADRRDMIAEIVKGQTTTIEFSVLCPELRGSGKLRFSLALNGLSEGPSLEFPLTLQRLNGPQLSRLLPWASNSAELEVPVGLYHLELGVSGDCVPIDSEREVIIREGVVTALEASFNCDLWWFP